jgi:hypothetical protein
MHRGLLLYVPTLTEMDVHGVGGIMRRDGEASAAVIISLLHARKKNVNLKYYSGGQRN